MTNTWLIGLSIVLSYVYLCCETNSYSVLKEISTKEASEKLAHVANTFAIDLYQKIIHEEVKTLVFSPFAVSVLLTSLMVGARGKTFKEINETLNYQNMTLEDVSTAFHDLFIDSVGDGYNLKIYKAIVFKQLNRIEPDFGEILGVMFMMDGIPVNFADPSAIHLVNEYVRNGTEGKINRFFSTSLEVDTSFLVLSATHFNGVWHTSFDPDLTEYSTFFSIGSKETKKVPMMSVTGVFDYYDDEELQAEFLMIPYEQEKGYLIVVLPKSRNGLLVLERELTLKTLLKALVSTKSVEVSVKIPKFDITSSFALKPYLKKMGIKRAFNPNLADFFGVMGRDDSWLSDVHQKNTFQVTERGTRASSAGAIKPRRAHTAKIEFKASHSFLYFVQDRRSGVIMLIGRVIDL